MKYKLKLGRPHKTRERYDIETNSIVTEQSAFDYTYRGYTVLAFTLDGFFDAIMDGRGEYRGRTLAFAAHAFKFFRTYVSDKDHDVFWAIVDGKNCDSTQGPWYLLYRHVFLYPAAAADAIDRIEVNQNKSKPKKKE